MLARYLRNDLDECVGDVSRIQGMSKAGHLRGNSSDTHFERRRREARDRCGRKGSESGALDGNRSIQ